MTPEDKPTPYSKQFPEVSGWYWMRGFRQYRTLPVEVSGNKFAIMYGNGVLFDAADAEGAEFAGPITAFDAEQLIELRRVGKAVLDTLETYKERHLVPPYLVNAMADLRDALAGVDRAVTVQCADCLTWFDKKSDHTCRQQVRRNQRSCK